MHAAVALAEKLQSEGRCDIFRGQTTDWPMRASFCRRSPADRKEAESRFLEFAGFVHATSELAALRGDRFGIMAIAQHYQIPTVLIDFSTKPAVAGWFSSHDDSPKAGRCSIFYMATWPPAGFLCMAGGVLFIKPSKRLLGPNILVEFGLAVGGQLATVPFSKIECCSALRPDLPDLLKPEFADLQKKPDLLLHQVIEPARLFDFDPFASVFGKCLIPGQFLFRQREKVFFSPAGIERIGSR